MALLARLRRGIRAYAWTEGIALLVVVLGASFWLSLAMDWCFEPPAALRVAVLLVVALLLAWVGYRFILRRIFVRLADRSLALVLERRFSQFRDSLVTAVELSQTPADTAGFDPEMLARTQQQALAGAAELPLGRVFDLGLLVRRGLLALVLLAAVIGFGLAESTALGIWARRSLMLSDEMWPRKTRLVAVGFDAGGRTKIARGADLELVVQADAAPGRDVPEIGRNPLRARKFARSRNDGPLGQRGHRTGSVSKLLHPSRRSSRRWNSTSAAATTVSVRCTSTWSIAPRSARWCCTASIRAYMNREPRDLPVAGAMSVPRGTRVTVRPKRTRTSCKSRSTI